MEKQISWKAIAGLSLSSPLVFLHNLCLEIWKWMSQVLVPAFWLVLIICAIFSSCVPRLSRVPAVKDFASGMLIAVLQGHILVQDAHLHGFFSPVPPQLYQILTGKLTPGFLSSRKSYFTSYLLWISSVFWKSLPFTWMSFLPVPYSLPHAKFTSHCKFDSLFFCYLPLDHSVNPLRGPRCAATMVHLESRGVYSLTVCLSRIFKPQGPRVFPWTGSCCVFSVTHMLVPPDVLNSQLLSMMC